MVENLDQWVREDFKDQKDKGCHTSTATYTVSLAGITTTTITGPVTVSATKKAEDAQMSQRCDKQDPTLYPILENDSTYTDWIIKMTCQFKSEKCEQVIDENFKDNQVIGDADIALYKYQQKHMSIVLEQVLKTTNGMKLTRKCFDNPWEILRLHEEHQHALVTSAWITTSLSQDLANTKVIDFSSPTKYLDTFDSKLEKLNLISVDPMPPSMSVGFFKISTHGNTELLSAWANCEIITERLTPNIAPTYDAYFEFLMSHAKKLEDSITNNLTSQKANVAESDYMQPYSPADEYFDKAADLSNFMVH